MSKFCGNCGTVMDDAAAVCGNCGAPLAEATQAPAAKGKVDVKAIIAKATGVAKEVVEGAKKGDKNSIIKGGIALAAVAVVIILVISLFSTPGYEGVAKKLIKAIDNDKPESIVKLLPQFVFEDDYEDEDDYADSFEDMIDEINDYMDEAIDSDKYSISYEIVDVDVYGKDYLENIEDNFDDFDGFNDKKLKKAVNMVIEATFKKGGKKHDVNISVVAIQYGSKWYLYDFAISGNAVTNDKIVDDSLYVGF